LILSDVDFKTKQFCMFLGSSATCYKISPSSFPSSKGHAHTPRGQEFFAGKQGKDRACFGAYESGNQESGLPPNVQPTDTSALYKQFYRRHVAIQVEQNSGDVFL